MSSIKVIKIGGKVIDDEQSRAKFLKDFASISGPKILVHGGGNIASDIGNEMGLTPNFVDGRRITDAETLRLVTMVYGGLVNKSMVAQLQTLNVQALGLTGADMNVIRSSKRTTDPIDFGFVGDVEEVNYPVLKTLLVQGICPVVAPLTHDGAGQMLNTNADTIAAEIAMAMVQKDNTVELIYCFEQSGVLNEGKVIEKMNLLTFRHLKGIGVVSDGMVPKLDTGFRALRAGVHNVKIKSFKALTEEAGTELVA